MTTHPLKALALAAQPGEWEWSEPLDSFSPGSLNAGSESVLYATGGDGYSGYVQCEPNNAAYIAAAHPAAILALIARVEEAERGLVPIRAERDALFEARMVIHDEERPIRTQVRLQAARIAELEQGLMEACDLAVAVASDSWRDDPEMLRIIAALRAMVKPTP